METTESDQTAKIIGNLADNIQQESNVENNELTEPLLGNLADNVHQESNVENNELTEPLLTIDASSTCHCLPQSQENIVSTESSKPSMNRTQSTIVNGKQAEEDIRANMFEYIKFLQTTEEFTTEDVSVKVLFLKKNVAHNEDRLLRKRLLDDGSTVGLMGLLPKIWPVLSNYSILENKSYWLVLKHLLSIYWNGTDISTSTCEELLRGDMPTFLLNILQSPNILHGDRCCDTVVYIIKSVLGTLHNLLQNCNESREIFRALDAVNVVKPYLAPNPDTKKISHKSLPVKALIALAYLINNSECDIINADIEHFKVLIRAFKSARTSTDPHHISRMYGMSCVELMRAVNQIAANDNNKDKLVSVGMLREYVKMLSRECSDDEKYEIMSGIHILSFKKECRESILSESGLIDKLSEVANGCAEEKTKRLAAGALWLLKEKPSTPEPTSDISSGHVMISYNWRHQDAVLEIRQHLIQAGLHVWMDVDDMSGSILQAMAQAIEQAAVVLICYSHDYYLSPNCRLEAEYTYQKRKPLIPIRMELYQPEDWLGILLGARLFVDMARAERRVAALTTLLREIAKIRNPAPAEVRKVSAAVTHCHGDVVRAHLALPPIRVASPKSPCDVPDHGAAVSLGSTADWSLTRVGQWLGDSGLHAYTDRFAECPGCLLLELKDMHTHAPQFFFETLKHDFSMPILDILKFTQALKLL